ncbi:hypothetical protein AABC73_13460 [Pseudomonas sp. G.S.17]|uniref:hypothetical protein n=1 Tax=Pseudomonas sp. G.S.17 TaxID=3137451 RepID=UPI00311CD331
MLVKILDADDDFVETLKRQTSTNTASKAYAHAAFQFQLLRGRIVDLEYHVESLQNELDDANSVLEGARAAALLVVEKTSQARLKI